MLGRNWFSALLLAFFGSVLKVREAEKDAGSKTDQSHENQNDNPGSTHAAGPSDLWQRGTI